MWKEAVVAYLYRCSSAGQNGREEPVTELFPRTKI